MKKPLLILLACVIMASLSGCSAWRNRMGKKFAAIGAKDYAITVWSGGVAVKEYRIRNSYVNSEDTSDGWYFFVDGQLVRVAGTVTIEEE